MKIMHPSVGTGSAGPFDRFAEYGERKMPSEEKDLLEESVTGYYVLKESK
ncbi:MAG: hypothetical protein ABSE05_14595 [Syntrophales bacterium]|jgi:hypothetical protein